MMLRYLDKKFWMRLVLFVGILMVLIRGPKIFHQPAKLITFTDEINTQAAAPLSDYSPISGLSFETEHALNEYLDNLPVGPSAHDWKFLHQEWFNYSRQWFERLYADPQLYDRYAKMWLQKRNDLREWRIYCRRNSFPELTDRELFDRIEWIRKQDEWKEMQSKINQGLEKIDLDYKNNLNELIESHYQSFEKLHGLFMKDNMVNEVSDTFFI